MFNTRNKSGISAHPCIIRYIITSKATNQRGEFSLITYVIILIYNNYLYPSLKQLSIRNTDHKDRKQHTVYYQRNVVSSHTKDNMIYPECSPFVMYDQCMVACNLGNGKIVTIGERVVQRN
jgi:hypothetical protein